MPSHNQPSQSQLEKMQQEAYNRVNEMHRRSQAIVKENTPEPQVLPPKTSQNRGQSQSSTPFQEIFGSIFPQKETIEKLSSLWDFKLDEEKALIGIIIYILVKNKADPKLIIGLGYLLL